ncbi:MAG: aromatic amino acid transport family protein [bacterium]|nr:aromatic amino acid transport family protein [bacterium]
MKIGKDYWVAISLLAGAIIGAGMFSLPFVFQSSGLTSGFFYLILITVIYAIVHLMYADVILRTKERHRFVGYANVYLGQNLFWLTVAMTVVEMIFVLAIYLVLSQSFVGLIVPSSGNLTQLLVFWLIGSVAIFASLRRLAFLESLITIGMVLIIIVIFILAWFNYTDLPDNLWKINFSNILFPLAPILFSLSGRVAIPILIDFAKLKGRKPSFIKRSVIWGIVIPAIIYGLFAIGIIMLSGSASVDAVSGLIGKTSPTILMIVGFLGLLSIFSSYILIGSDIKETLRYDLQMPGWLRLLIVVGSPVFLYFIGFQGLIGLIGIVGGIFLTIEGIMMVVIWLRADKILSEPSQLIGAFSRSMTWVLILVFAVTFVYEIIK